MRSGQSAASRPVPAVVACLGIAYLAAALGPPLTLAAVAAAAAVSTCSLVLVRRPSRSLHRLLAGLAAWLLAGLAGAWLVRRSPLGGLAWTLLVVYLLPLPLIPWLYARTFVPNDEGNHALRDSFPHSEARTPDPGSEGER